MEITLSVDINLSSLQAMSEEASRGLYQGQTTVGILSPVGLLAGYSADSSKLAQRFDVALCEAAEKLINKALEAA